MSKKQIELAAKMAGQWWADRLKPRHAHHAKKIAKEIRKRVAQELRGECHWDWWGECHKGVGYENMSRIEFDYDPHGLLVAAWDAATGLPQWESRDAWPVKTKLDVSPTEMKPKEGYGNWTATIPVTPAGRSEGGV